MTTTTLKLLLIIVGSASALTAGNVKAAVLIPGFLTGAKDFEEMCLHLSEEGIPTVAVPMPNWHWLPCLGGRSARPILERIDFTVKHLIQNDGDVTKIPPYKYSAADCWKDFWTNPGGVAQVGGSSNVDEFPTVQPQGTFTLPIDLRIENQKKVALIGHSAGGWIARAYLSEREYAGKAYNGERYIHSLVTLGTPHADAPGPAFASIRWLLGEKETKVPSLAVGGAGFDINEWGGFTEGAYAFCCPVKTCGITGDGVTPLESSLNFKGATSMELPGRVHHFCWSDVFGGSIVSPELSKDYGDGISPWYGSKEIVAKWAGFLLKQT